MWLMLAFFIFFGSIGASYEQGKQDGLMEHCVSELGPGERITLPGQIELEVIRGRVKYRRTPKELKPYYKGGRQ